MWRRAAAPRRRRRRRAHRPRRARPSVMAASRPVSVSARRAQRSGWKRRAANATASSSGRAFNHSHWRRTASGTSRPGCRAGATHPRGARPSEAGASRHADRRAIDASRRWATTTATSSRRADADLRGQAALLPGLATGESAGQAVDAVVPGDLAFGHHPVEARPAPSLRRSRTTGTTARGRRRCRGRLATQQQARHHRAGRQRPLEQRFLRRPGGERDVTRLLHLL